MDSQSLPVTTDKRASEHSGSSATRVTADRIVDGAKLVAVLLIIACVAYHVDNDTGKLDLCGMFE